MKTFRKIVLAGLIGLSSLVPNLSSADYLNNGRLLAVAETKNVRECLFYSRYGNDRVVAIDSDDNGKVDRIQRLNIPKSFGDFEDHTGVQEIYSNWRDWEIYERWFDIDCNPNNSEYVRLKQKYIR